MTPSYAVSVGDDTTVEDATTSVDDLPLLRRLPRALTALGVIAGLSAAIGGLAAVGGLETVAASGPAQHRIDETFVTSQLSLSVERIAVVDTLPGSGSFPDQDAGERVLAILVEVTNLDVEPRSAWGSGGLSTMRLEGRPEDTPNISISGDLDYSSVTLQPDVPTRVLLTWVVAADEIDGAGVHVRVQDAVKSDSTLFRGESYWNDSGTESLLTGPVEDLGAGDEDGTL